MPPGRWIPAGCVAVFFLLGVCLRAAVHRLRHGSWGIALFRSGSAGQHVRDALLLLLGASLAALAAAAAVAPEALSSLGTVPGLGGAAATAAGAAIVIAATALMVLSQVHLGASWRIGIEDGARPGLVTTGLYRFCRHPIYLFLLLALAGFVLIVPTWATVAVAVAAWAGIRAQVAEEERWLDRTYGDDFRAWSSRVGRFVPWVGRR